MQTEADIRPTVEREISTTDGLGYELYGLNTGNWALQAPDRDLEDHNQAIFHRLGRIAQRLGIHQVLCPSTNKLTSIIGTTRAFPNVRSTSSAHFFRGFVGEGAVLGHGQMIFFGTADCPVVIARSKTCPIVVVAHAGRDNLLDRQLINTGKPSRRDESVVNAIVKCFPPDHVYGLDVRAICGIKPNYFWHRWRDPTYGERNKKMVKYILNKWGGCFAEGSSPEEGKIDIFELIRHQFSGLGVHIMGPSNDGIDTKLDMPQFGTGFIWHSHSRDREKSGRNGVIVYRQ